jgi:hypothetical protein
MEVSPHFLYLSQLPRFEEGCPHVYALACQVRVLMLSVWFTSGLLYFQICETIFQGIELLYGL